MESRRSDHASIRTCEVQLPEPIKKWLPLALTIGTAGSLGYFATQVVESAATPFWQHVAPSIPQKLLLSLCCLLLLVAAILAAWVVFLHRSLSRLQRTRSGPATAELRKRFDDQFGEFVERYGVWRHKTKEGFYCPRCKAKEIESRMQVDESGSICPLCAYNFVR